MPPKMDLKDPVLYFADSGKVVEVSKLQDVTFVSAEPEPNADEKMPIWEPLEISGTIEINPANDFFRQVILQGVILRGAILLMRKKNKRCAHLVYFGKTQRIQEKNAKRCLTYQQRRIRK